MIRALIVDDQALFRAGLHTLLSVQPDLQVVGEARHGEEALRLAAVLTPDIILMDLHPPILDGVAATRRLKSTHPAIKVLVLFDDDEDVFEALRAGAVGYLLKDVPSEKLVEAIRGVARGDLCHLSCACNSPILSMEDIGCFYNLLINQTKVLAISFQRVNGGLLVKVGAQDWVDQIAVGAVGVVIHPPLITAAIGAVQQNTALHDVLNSIDQHIRQQQPQAQAEVPLPSSM